MAVENNLLEIARRDINVAKIILGTTNDEIMQNMAAYHVQQAVEKILKQQLIDARGYGSIEHDIERLLQDAKSLKIIIPEWVEENSYVISKWATTIRYNSNFKTNRDEIIELCGCAEKWLDEVEKN